MSIGNHRIEFTVIGDTVNTASRFFGLATRTARDNLGRGFEVRQLPSTKITGKAEEVEVFEVVY